MDERLFLLASLNFQRPGLLHFGFAVAPKEGPLHINYATKNQLERWGRVPVRTAHVLFANSEGYNTSISNEVGAATLTQFSFKIPGSRSSGRTPWKVFRNVVLDDELHQQELLPFLNYIGPEGEAESRANGLFVIIGRLAMPDTGFEVRRQMINEFLSEQPNYAIPDDPVTLSRLTTHWA